MGPEEVDVGHYPTSVSSAVRSSIEFKPVPGRSTEQNENAFSSSLIRVDRHLCKRRISGQRPMVDNELMSSRTTPMTHVGVKVWARLVEFLKAIFRLADVGPTFWSSALHRLKVSPACSCCPHQHGCLHYILKVGVCWSWYQCFFIPLIVCCFYHYDLLTVDSIVGDIY